MHEELYKLKETLMHELEEYARKDMSAGSLEIIDKLAHAIKNICKIIEAYEDEEGYSGDMGAYRNAYTYARGGRYSREGGSRTGSYARGRNTRRDSMGRYSSEMGYSRTSDVGGLVEDIREMMPELPEEIKRDAQKFVMKLEEHI